MYDDLVQRGKNKLRGNRGALTVLLLGESVKSLGAKKSEEFLFSGNSSSAL